MTNNRGAAKPYSPGRTRGKTANAQVGSVVGPPLVGCCVANPGAEDRIVTAIRTNGSLELMLRADQLIAPLLARHGTSALVCDLAPASSKTVEALHTLCGHLPAMPILIYAPRVPKIESVIESVLRLPNVSLKFQFEDLREYGRTEDAVAELIRSVPAKRVARLVLLLFDNLPMRVADFIEAALDNIASAQRKHAMSVKLVARQCGIGVRTLEREFSRTALSSPKEALDWLTYLHVTFLAASSGITTGRAAKMIGIQAGALYRLRTRLLGDGALKWIGGDQEFDIVILTFARRYGLPRKRMSGSVSQLLAVEIQHSKLAPIRK